MQDNSLSVSLDVSTQQASTDTCVTESGALVFSPGDMIQLKAKVLKGGQPAPNAEVVLVAGEDEQKRRSCVV